MHLILDSQDSNMQYVVSIHIEIKLNRFFPLIKVKSLSETDKNITLTFTLTFFTLTFL